jgi:YesN/AraC family two-component response regulator
MGKVSQEDIEEILENQREILEGQKEIKKMLKQLLDSKGTEKVSASSVAESYDDSNEKPFVQGKYQGKTPSQVLAKDPNYIEFIYKSYVGVANPVPKWSMVTKEHFQKAMKALGKGDTEESPPPPPGKKKPAPAQDLEEDDIPF